MMTSLKADAVGRNSYNRRLSTFPQGTPYALPPDRRRLALLEALMILADSILISFHPNRAPLPGQAVR